MTPRPAVAKLLPSLALATLALAATVASSASGPVTRAPGETTAGTLRGPTTSGGRVTAPEAPEVERVVSVVPAATETLFAIGAGELVVGVGSYDTWPPEVRELPSVGGYVDPNFELIVSLRPDLAIVDAGQGGLVERLREAGIDSLEFRHGDLDFSLEMIVEVGRAVGRSRAGRRLADDLRRELETLRNRYRVPEPPRTMMVFGRAARFRDVWVVGAAGFLGELLEIAGGDNVFGDTPRESFKAGLETILSRSPEVILEMLMYQTADARDADAARSRWRSLPGFGRVRVGLLAADHVGRPGPRMPETVRLIARNLHGGAPSDGSRGVRGEGR